MSTLRFSAWLGVLAVMVVVALHPNQAMRLTGFLVLLSLDVAFLYVVFRHALGTLQVASRRIPPGGWGGGWSGRVGLQWGSGVVLLAVLWWEVSMTRVESGRRADIEPRPQGS